MPNLTFSSAHFRSFRSSLKAHLLWVTLYMLVGDCDERENYFQDELNFEKHKVCNNWNHINRRQEKRSNGNKSKTH